ncbi:MAG: fluoride efflux transporter CrcB [Syntrophobacteraceae bacterium]|jgi:CrcB protein|nr:fluoride efflux transporter CrcB [Syntrophobacteraceae bacterium]
MTKILLLMLGGSLGALSRYSATLLAVRLLGTRFPFGTLVANLSGCFLIGLSFALVERGFAPMSPTAYLFFVTGYLGSLTTFSTFALETVSSMGAGTRLVPVMNILCNNVFGAALALLGMWIGGLDF